MRQISIIAFFLLLSAVCLAFATDTIIRMICFAVVAAILISLVGVMYCHMRTWATIAAVWKAAAHAIAKTEEAMAMITKAEHAEEDALNGDEVEFE